MAICHKNNFICNPIKVNKCSRCGNLLENPSFEAGTTSWVTNNVSASGENHFEGTDVARMGQTAPSMFQDVLLQESCRQPLFLSFQILAPSVEAMVGDLIIEVIWLNAKGNVIGTGLRTLIPAERTSENRNILTFVEITDIPPDNAVKARLQFSKGARTSNTTNILDIDNIILAPINTINLIKNSGFELGLTNWTFTNAFPHFRDNYEGTGRARLLSDGTLFQNVPINRFIPNSSFLLSFAVIGGSNPGSLRAQVIWLNQLGAPIGTGLDLFINGEMLNDQSNFTTYVDVTKAAPDNAVTAQIKFTSTPGQNSFHIDKVIFARVRSTNLLKNSSFENGLSPWVGEGVNVIQTDESYEGNKLLRIDADGGFVFQDVPVQSERCYLLNFGYEVVAPGSEGNLIAQVDWLDQNGGQIDCGLSIIILEKSVPFAGKWVTYLGVTEPAPPNAVRARIQFSKSRGIGDTLVGIDIDKVVFARLI